MGKSYVQVNANTLRAFDLEWSRITRECYSLGFDGHIIYTPGSDNVKKNDNYHGDCIHFEITNIKWHAPNSLYTILFLS